jgi:hypothetical protein
MIQSLNCIPVLQYQSWNVFNERVLKVFKFTNW